MCIRDSGYKEAFDKEFHEVENDKLSENGVIAEKTMNTLLHVFEAYTELYRVAKLPEVKERLEWIMDTFADKVYNPKLHRQEVFLSLIHIFSKAWESRELWSEEIADGSFCRCRAVSEKGGTSMTTGS